MPMDQYYRMICLWLTPPFVCQLVGWFEQQKFTVSQSEDQKSEIEVSAGLVPSAACEGGSAPSSPLVSGGCWQSLAFLSLSDHPTLRPHLHMVLPVCARMSRFPLLVRTLVIFSQGPTLLCCDLIVTNYVYNHPISKEGCILKFWG